PAPAAALLSGIVSKVAVMAIIRLSHYSFNWQIIHGTWVQTVLIWMILLTVFLGSMLAFKEKLFARRLAYSSVSQLSYVLFGVILLMPMGLLGAMLHILFHAIIKVVLFLSQGAIEHKTGKTMVGELKGIGKSMPVVMWCFTIAALALVGIPPTGGFVSKWFLAMAGISSGLGAVGIIGAGILLVSALLTGGYLITIFAAGFFPGAKFDYAALSPRDPGKKMTVPLIVLAVLALVPGMFPAVIIDFINDIAATLFAG
ncbi:MAG: proton-conducting membrane transporter, partial [Clostridiales bacterium]|nr:proton-conducting membrane transporter [Clostridiales bacterium]